MSSISIPQPGRPDMNQTVPTVVILDPATGEPVAPSGSGGSGPSTVAVSNFPAIQRVSASALPLPSGAATAAGVTAVATSIGVATARAAVTDPTAAADVNQLLRGILKAVNDQTALLQTIADNTTPTPAP